MKAVDHYADTLAINLVDDLLREIERLYRAIGLSQEFEGERDTVRFRNIRELIQNADRFGNDLRFGSVFRQLSGYDDQIGAIKLSGDSRKLAAFGLDQFIILSGAKRYVFDRIYRIRVDVIIREQGPQLVNGMCRQIPSQL